MVSDRPVPERLRRAMARARLAPAAGAAWRGTPPAPAAGQLWRAAWATTAMLVLLTDVAESEVGVVATTTDIALADDRSRVVPIEGTTLGVELCVWADARARIPMCALDRCLGTLVGEWNDATQEEQGPSAVTSVVSDLDPHREYRAHLLDTLDGLAGARWAPSGSGRLAALLRDRGIELRSLAASGIPTPQALSIMRGQGPVTSDQAQTLAAQMNMTPEDVLAANPALPEPLVARLSRPARRAQVRALARATRAEEIPAWQQVGYGAWALAARTTGDRSDDAWDARIDRYLEAVLGE